MLEPRRHLQHRGSAPDPAKPDPSRARTHALVLTQATYPLGGSAPKPQGTDSSKQRSALVSGHSGARARPGGEPQTPNSAHVALSTCSLRSHSRFAACSLIFALRAKMLRIFTKLLRNFLIRSFAQAKLGLAQLRCGH